MKKIFINADDFGLKSSVNLAIIELFNHKLINSATIMANMPGFDEAVELAFKNNINDKIGIHLTLSEGAPLTSEILSTNLFFNENNLDHTIQKRNLFFLNKSEKILIFKEFSAQIEKVRNAGIQITHIDTHHHMHESWPITQIILILLKTYNIPSMRILNNLNRSTRFYKRGYRKLINEFIKSKHVNFSDFFGNQLEAISQLRNDPSIFTDKKLEIMVHPDYNSNGAIIDKIKNREYNFEYPEDLLRLISMH